MEDTIERLNNLSNKLREEENLSKFVREISILAEEIDLLRKEEDCRGLMIAANYLQTLFVVAKSNDKQSLKTRVFRVE